MERRVVTLQPSARSDVAGAYVYYRERSSALARAFLDEGEHALNRIQQFPEAAPIAYKGFRMKLTRRFPYRNLCGAAPEPELH